MIWNFTIYSLRDRIALDTTTLDTASQIIQGIRSVVIDKINHFCFERFSDITLPTFSSDTPPSGLFDEVFFFCFNKVYESSASKFVTRMISDGIKNSRSENILTRLCCNKRMDA